MRATVRSAIAVLAFAAALASTEFSYSQQQAEPRANTDQTFERDRYLAVSPTLREWLRDPSNLVQVEGNVTEILRQQQINRAGLIMAIGMSACFFFVLWRLRSFLWNILENGIVFSGAMLVKTLRKFRHGATRIAERILERAE